MNICLFKGILDKVELRFTPAGKPVFKGSMVVEEITDRGTFRQYPQLVAWGKTAERLGAMQQGMTVILQTSFSINKWKDRDGKDVKTPEFKVDKIVYADEVRTAASAHADQLPDYHETNAVAATGVTGEATGEEFPF